MTQTVREATFDVFRRRELTTLFSNPGSTEVPFLTGLPEDFRFVLGLHEGSVLALATGFAIGAAATFIRSASSSALRENGVM